MVAVIEAQPIDDHTLRVRFDDGVEREVDLSDVMWGPMGEPRKDPEFFRQVSVDSGLRTVTWPNEDDIFHNVFSMSPEKKFNLGYYKEEVKQVVFEKSGRVDIFCSIHKEMHCIILVVDSPWIATVDANGRYTFSDVPAGTYDLTGWHERLPESTQRIVVPENGTVKTELTLTVSGLPDL